MADKINLYIGLEPHHVEYNFTSDDPQWISVRTQIENASRAGNGIITIPRRNGGEGVFVYSSALLIRWAVTPENPNAEDPLPNS